MNVSGTEPQACAPASAALARDAGNGHPATAADAAAFFLGLLTQATATTAPAAVPTPGLLPTLATASQDEADTAETTEAPVDWVLPFLTPLPGTPPAPLDLELPATGTAGALTPVAAPDAGDGNPVPLPVLVDDAHLSKESATLVAPDPARAPDASGSAPVAVTAPRIEATGNGETNAVVRHVAVPVRDGRWAEHVGHEVRILVERGVQAATLRLTPEHLGPVDVRIDIVNDKANVVFGAAHADTRAALSEAIPKLREMFAGAGLTLGDAGVRQDTPGQFSGSGPHDPRFGGGIDAVETETATVVQVTRIGLVDAYA